MSEDSSKQTRFDEAAEKINSLTNGAVRLSLIILFAVAAWRLAWSKLSLDLSRFDFSDLLAMILALFAMAMSVAFYFKSTDSSNQFYDNIYNFTQKTSEILGRIEERFGERLRHIDEGYRGLQSHFDGISRSPDEVEKKVKETEGKEKKEKERLEETKKAMQDLMETLAERAKLEQQEKEEFYSKMRKLEAAKNAAQKRLREIEEDRDRLREQIMMMDEGLMEETSELFRHPFVIKMIHHPEVRHMLHAGAPTRIIQKRFRNFINRFSEEHLETLREFGVINRRGEVTTAGVMLLRSVARRMDIDF